MKLNVCGINKAVIGKKDLPSQFNELIRPDLVKRAVEAIQANRRQPYGAMPRAGMRYSAFISKRRKDYKGCYGKGISRTPRKTLNRRGSQMFWVGALAPNTVGGRRAHPPKALKEWHKKINKKERRMAIRSALAATAIKELVTKRGHMVPSDYPFIIDTKLESIMKTSEFEDILGRLGFGDELDRISERKIRAGRGRLRGRRYIVKKGPLIVVSRPCVLLKTGTNLPGIEVVEVDKLNAELLAPGADIGRLTLFTEAAIERLAKEGLFTLNYKGPKIEKPKKEAIAAEKQKPAKKEAKAPAKKVVNKEAKKTTGK